jgi:metal-responsive CopG/Arc/MetJ family transcriptional regulator
MRAQTVPVRKITVSLPSELVDFADDQAAKNNTSRSSVISLILARAKALEEERLAAEGYQFYAQESAEFAGASASAVAEAIGGGKASEHDG